MKADVSEMDRRATPDGVTARRTSLDDLPAVVGISNWATRNTTANFKSEPDTLEQWNDLWRGTARQYPWFVAERDGSVIGFTMALPFKER